MLNETELLSLYRNYSDQELLKLFSNNEGYSEEAKVIIYKVVEEKGGIEKLQQNLNEKIIIDKEIFRIRLEVRKLFSQETNAEFVKKLLPSDILTKEQLDETVDEEFEQLTTYKAGNSVDFKTILFAVLGIIVSSIAAGYLWSLMIGPTNNSNRIPYFVICGLILLCYFIILGFTRKSKFNPVVLAATAIAIIVAFLIAPFFL
jgi:hypothetical protein